MLDADTTQLGALYANLSLPKFLPPGIAWSTRTVFAHATAARASLAELEALRLPVLLISGDRDPVCLPTLAQAAAAIRGMSRCGCRTIRIGRPAAGASTSAPRGRTRARSRAAAALLGGTPCMNCTPMESHGAGR